MPSFDIVSEVDNHELTNALDQANREVITRYDFKGVKASFTQQDDKIVMVAENEFQLKQMLDIFYLKCAKRQIDAKFFKAETPQLNLNQARQDITLKQGIDKELAKKIIKIIKDSKIKVQPSQQGDQVRVAGKKRDDLQEAIVLIKKQELDLPLQFENFRD